MIQFKQLTIQWTLPGDLILGSAVTRENKEKKTWETRFLEDLLLLQLNNLLCKTSYVDVHHLLISPVLQQSCPEESGWVGQVSECSSLAIRWSASDHKGDEMTCKIASVGQLKGHKVTSFSRFLQSFSIGIVKHHKSISLKKRGCML